MWKFSADPMANAFMVFVATVELERRREGKPSLVDIIVPILRERSPDAEVVHLDVRRIDPDEQQAARDALRLFEMLQLQMPRPPEPTA